MRILSLLFFLTGSSMAENWPAWRGPDGDGTSSEKSLPARWSSTENIAWKTPIAGEGHSSPIVWGDRVFSDHEPDGEKRTPAAVPGSSRRKDRLGSRRFEVAARIGAPPQQPRLGHAGHRWETRLRHLHVGQRRKSDRAKCQLGAADHAWPDHRRRLRLRWEPEVESGRRRFRQRARIQHLPCAVRRSGHHQRRPRRRCLHRGARSRDRRRALAHHAREQDAQLRDPDHPQDRRAHADDPLGQQVGRELRSANRQTALAPRRSDGAVRGIDGLQRRIRLRDRRLSRKTHSRDRPERDRERHRDPRPVADEPGGGVCHIARCGRRVFAGRVRWWSRQLFRRQNGRPPLAGAAGGGTELIPSAGGWHGVLLLRPRRSHAVPFGRAV